jgi:hypothetical protein
VSVHYFDWKTIEEDIVVPEQAAIAVYNNPEGGIVLRQAGQYGPDEDTTVVLHPSHALLLARAILDRAGLDMEIVPITAPRIQNGGGEILQPSPDQRTINAIRNTGPTAADNANSKKDRTAAERQRRHREKQRERDSHDADRDIDVTDRDTVTSAPLVPELDLNGGQNKALAH